MKHSLGSGGTLVLDCEGLAKVVRRDREMTRWLALARADDLRVATSAAILVEAMHPGIKKPAFEWALSRLVVEPVTDDLARAAAGLLSEAGLHGHRHAIDAMLCATALASAKPVIIVTSDRDDLTRLCGAAPGVTVVKV